MTATLLDIVTGKTVEVDGITDWVWSEGNWGCDCNRCIYFGLQEALWNHNEHGCGTCIGHHRFLVVAAAAGGREYSRPEVLQLNGHYPEELIQKWIPE